MQIKSLQFQLVVLLVIGLSLAFLFGCASHKSVNEPCQELDWYELGRTDGAKGLASATQRQVKPICPSTDVSLSEALYQNGYDSSIANYCTFHAGFLAGKSSQKVNATNCPPMLRDDFQKGYQRGQRFSQLQKNQKDISMRIKSLDASLSDRTLDLARRGLLHGQKLELESQIKAVKREIAGIQKDQALE